MVRGEQEWGRQPLETLKRPKRQPKKTVLRQKKKKTARPFVIKIIIGS